MKFVALRSNTLFAARVTREIVVGTAHMLVAGAAAGVVSCCWTMSAVMEKRARDFVEREANRMDSPFCTVVAEG